MISVNFYSQGNITSEGRERVLRIKENSVDVVYRDEYQVAVRPKKKRH